MLDSGCAGGHLLNTSESHHLLSQSRRTTKHSFYSSTGKTRAEYLPLLGIVFYASIDTVNLLSLDL